MLPDPISLVTSAEPLPIEVHTRTEPLNEEEERWAAHTAIVAEVQIAGFPVWSARTAVGRGTPWHLAVDHARHNVATGFAARLAEVLGHVTEEGS